MRYIWKAVFSWKSLIRIIYLVICLWLVLKVLDLENTTIVIIFTLLAPYFLTLIDGISDFAFGSFSLKMKLILVRSFFLKGRRIRVSVANLLKVKIGDKYLLIEKIRDDERFFIPIGGVSHYTSDEIKSMFFIDEDNYENRDKKDLRFYMEEQKMIPLFHYLKEMRNHEIGVMREIAEEIGFCPNLKEILIRGEQSFLNCKASYEKVRDVEKFRKAKAMLFYFRIFELHLSDIESDKVKELTEKKEKFYLATRDEIEDYEKHQILDYTRYLLKEFK